MIDLLYYFFSFLFYCLRCYQFALIRKRSSIYYMEITQTIISGRVKLNLGVIRKVRTLKIGSIWASYTFCIGKMVFLYKVYAPPPPPPLRTCNLWTPPPEVDICIIQTFQLHHNLFLCFFTSNYSPLFLRLFLYV